MSRPRPTEIALATSDTPPVANAATIDAPICSAALAIVIRRSSDSSALMCALTASIRGESAEIPRSSSVMSLISRRSQILSLP